MGLHNGLKVNLKLKPAEANTGIIFKRVDVEEDKNIIEANYKNVSSSALCTKIQNSQGVSVSTIEHLMAAFYGEGIDNVLDEIDSPEIPKMDGSSFDFVTAIRSFSFRKEKFLYFKKVSVLSQIGPTNSTFPTIIFFDFETGTILCLALYLSLIHI